jgi:hypothetical protein
MFLLRELPIAGVKGLTSNAPEVALIVINFSGDSDIV